MRVFGEITLVIIFCLIVLVLLQGAYMFIQPRIDRKYCSNYILKVENYYIMNGAYPKSLKVIEQPPALRFWDEPYCEYQVNYDLEGLEHYYIWFRSWRKGLDGIEVYDPKQEVWD